MSHVFRVLLSDCVECKPDGVCANALADAAIVCFHKSGDPSNVITVLLGGELDDDLTALRFQCAFDNVISTILGRDPKEGQPSNGGSVARTLH